MSTLLVKRLQLPVWWALLGGLFMGCAEGQAMPADFAGPPTVPAGDGMPTTMDPAPGTDGTQTGDPGGTFFMGVACTIGLPEPCACEDGQIGLQTCEENADSPSGAAVTGCGSCGMALGNLPGDDGTGGAMDGSAGMGGTDPMTADPPMGGDDAMRSCDPSACPTNPLFMSCCKTDGTCGLVDVFDPNNCI